MPPVYIRSVEELDAVVKIEDTNDNILRDPRGTVVAVNVPPSLHLVALWHSERRSQFEEKNSIEYLYRDSHGKKWMNPDEVERHIMNGSRAAKLAFDQALDRAPTREV